MRLKELEKCFDKTGKNIRGLLLCETFADQYFVSQMTSVISVLLHLVTVVFTVCPKAICIEE